VQVETVTVTRYTRLSHYTYNVVIIVVKAVARSSFGGGEGRGVFSPLPFSFPSSIPFSHKIQLDFASVVTYVNPKRGQGWNPGRNGPFGVFRAGNACSGCKCSISVEQNPKIEILRDRFLNFYFGGVLNLK